MLIKKGIAASLGIAIGKVHIVKEENILIEQKEIPRDKLKAEIKRFKDGLDNTRLVLDYIRVKVLDVLVTQKGKRLDAHHMILQDHLITREVKKLIAAKCVNAESLSGYWTRNRNSKR